MKKISFLLLFVSTSLLAQKPADEKAAVVATVQALFDAMEQRDTLAAQKLMMPGGLSYVTVQGRDTAKAILFTNESFINQLKRPDVRPKERMWQVEVKVHGRIAQLWASYDLYVNGKFSHCGIDAFTLVKEPDGWKITGAAFTVEKTGCKPPEE